MFIKFEAVGVVRPGRDLLTKDGRVFAHSIPVQVGAANLELQVPVNEKERPKVNVGDLVRVTGFEGVGYDGTMRHNAGKWEVLTPEQFGKLAAQLGAAA